MASTGIREHHKGKVNYTQVCVLSLQVLQFLHAVLVELADLPGETQAALGMLLVAAVAASQEARSELLAYDFFEQVTAHTVAFLPRGYSLGAAVKDHQRAAIIVIMMKCCFPQLKARTSMICIVGIQPIQPALQYKPGSTNRTPVVFIQFGCRLAFFQLRLLSGCSPAAVATRTSFD